MNAQDIHLTELLEGPKQFIVPIFQRDYSWGTKHCLQLWKDIIRVGSDPNAKAHFIGSVVYIASEDNSAKITRWLLIDGQQRLTTVALLLTAVRNQMTIKHDIAQPQLEEGLLPAPDELDDYYLRNRHGKADLQYKLHLRRTDHDSLASLLDGKELPVNASVRIRENFEFFKDQLVEADLNIVYLGIKKLVAVDVSLTRGQDDPQMIFESLNSTGQDLTQADLIRNFVLMRQEEKTQTQLYQDFWQPVEMIFGSHDRTDFDKFMRDYITIQNKQGKQINSDTVYHQFQTYYYENSATRPVVDILASVRTFATYYVCYNFGQEQNSKLKDVFQRVHSLIDVASPLVMRLYECYEQFKTLTIDEFIEAMELLESYVFRRSMCDMQTRSLGQIFVSLSRRIKTEEPLLTLKIALWRQGKNRRFPSDSEFRESLETRNVYDMRRCKYLLDRLENDSKEQINTSSFSIEHIMPQNENLNDDWQTMLGPGWKEIKELWLHRLGNVTLTGYNSEYQDRSFADKKTIANGFNDSPLRLNKYIREQQAWTPVEMEKRGKHLATKAISIWPSLVVDIEVVKKSELEDRKIQAARFSVEKLEFDSEAKALFDVLRPQILAIGNDVAELCWQKSVTYRVYDFFVEIIPRKHRLLLNINLDYDECDDPTQRIENATEYAFITYASESGGVLFTVDNLTHLTPAMNIIRQAYEKVSE